MTAEAAIGRLLAPQERRAWPGGELRSAFVISAGYVLSAWHCVEAVGGTTAQGWLRLQPPEGTDEIVDVPVSYRAHQPDLDAALLTVDVERLGGDADRLRDYLDRIALPLGLAVQPHSPVRVGGFPERNPARFPTLFVGRVESADALIGGTRAIRVYVAEFAARYTERPGGMSGGPLLHRVGAHRERVVGFVSAYPQAPGDAGATGGTVICRSTADLRRAFPEIDEVLRKSEANDGSALRAMVPAGSRIYISSSPDVPSAYREAAAEVCRRHGLTPVDPNSFLPATRASVDVRRKEMITCRMLVLLLAGQRSDPGFTATEYDWASADSKVVIVPFMAVSDPVSVADPIVAGGLLERVEADHRVLPLSDPGTFRLDLYQAIERCKQRRSAKSRSTFAKQWPAGGHRRRKLPSPPDLCAMPPYVGGSPFTGRGSELDDLDAWARSDDPVMVVDAIGGTGKSALTWEWMTTRAAQAINRLAGSFWWSFYDRSASIERFLRELLGYLRTESEFNVSQIPRDELTNYIVQELRRRPFVVVLDGFERLLVAYHQYDPTRVTDVDVDEDRRTNKHAIVDALGYEFVRLLVAASPSKILISTRILPDALEQPGGAPRRGTVRLHLPGLSDSDTRVLLDRLGVTGDADTVQSFFAPLGNHPLLIAIVAGMVRDFRPRPGDFGAWVQRQPFEIGDMHLAERKNHILAAALDGLDSDVGRLLGWLSALPGSVQWHVVESVNPYQEHPAATSATAGALLDAALRDLEARGLVWWNRAANTYDMHPIVRAIAAARMGSAERVGANERIADFFQAEPPEQPETVTSVEDLQQTIALFRALTSAEKYSSATFVWKQLAGPLLYSLGANATIAELLQPYEGTIYTALRADLSISLHLAGDHERGLAVELATLNDLFELELGPDAEILTSLGRIATHYRSMGRLAAYANVLRLLSTGTSNSDRNHTLGLTLRTVILDAIRGNHAVARAALDGLEGSRVSSGNNPWFRSDVRYWSLVLDLWSSIGPREDAIGAAEEEFPNWRNRLRLSDLRFEVLMRRRAYAPAKSAADDIDRLRRVGGQHVMPAENAVALACLGQKAEAAAAIDECLAALSRVHPFDRPYYRLAFALATLGRHDESARMALLARQRAWADGPTYCYRWDLGDAEALLNHLGVPLPPLPRTQGKDEKIPNLRRVEHALRRLNVR